MKHSRKIAIVAVVALMLLVRAGLSYAWFSQRAALSTLMDIIPPDSIEIYPVDTDGNNLAMLDLDFKEGDLKDEETGKITIRRPVKIYSTSPVHQLEVVHTTNLKKLSFKIYPATKNGKEYKYDSAKNLTGSYINPIAVNDSSLAAKENLNNYKDGNNVEAHAYPLYWLAENSGDSRFVDDTDKSKIVTTVTSETETKIDPAKQVEKTYYTTYYILEISWQENTKETDLFYIMAQNIAVTEKTDGSEGGGNA